MAVDFTKVPIGTKVETAYGHGEIVNTCADAVFPIEVMCGCRRRTYTKEGRRTEFDTRPTLFLAPFEWPEQEQPLPDLAVDTPVMVRARGGDWRRRHFCRWEDGRCVTFTDGLTSWSTKTTYPWSEWRLPTEAELKGTDNVE